MTEIPIWTVHERAGGGFALHRGGIVVTGFATRARAEETAAALNPKPKPPAPPAIEPGA